MRVVLVGSVRQRDAMRRRLDGSALSVLAEYDTLAQARADDVAAEAILLPPSPPRRDDEDTVTEALTPREVAVLELLAEGLPNKAIAERLDISDQTVKFHVASIAGKLNAINRTDAVRRAARSGLITL